MSDRINYERIVFGIDPAPARGNADLFSNLADFVVMRVILNCLRFNG